MYRRYYDGYGKVRNNSDPGEIIVPQRSDTTYGDNRQNPIAITSGDDCCEIQKCDNKKGILGLDCELDDLLLIGVLLFLLWDSENADPILIIIIGFIFLSEIL